MSETIKEIGRIVVNAYYDYQKIRIASTNRIRDVVRKKVEGIPFDQVEEKKEKKKFDNAYSDNNLKKLWDKLLNDEKITSEEHAYLKKCWILITENKTLEKKYQRLMKKYISQEIVFEKFLSKIKGIGPVLSANLIKMLGNCSKFDTVSKLWACTGNAVFNGKIQRLEKGKKAGFSPSLKTLSWKIADSLLKSNKGFYRQFYDTEKQKQLNRTYEMGVLEEKYGKPYKKEDTHITKGHAHNRALRKKRKIFLDHYWHASRELSGLPAKKNYVEGILRHNHIVTWKDAIIMEAASQLVIVNQSRNASQDKVETQSTIASHK